MHLSDVPAVCHDPYVTLAHWEERWLTYARRLLRDDEHHAACDRLLGAEALSRADAPDLRWPGYVGSGYRPGGVLLAATVHREFASGNDPLPASERDALVDATRAWRGEAISDEAWLRIVRRVYRAGLDRHWGVGSLLRGLQRRIGVSVDDVAYVNAARCQVVEDEPVLANIASIKRKVTGLCSAQYPIAELAGLLGAGAIVVTKRTHDLAAASLAHTGSPVFVVDQRQQVLRAPFG